MSKIFLDMWRQGARISQNLWSLDIVCAYFQIMSFPNGTAARLILLLISTFDSPSLILLFGSIHVDINMFYYFLFDLVSSSF